MLGMEWDPHTLHLILQRIRHQMRCPQCGEKVPVDMNGVRMTGDDFLLLQLKCDVCDAYIVLHASLQGLKLPEIEEKKNLDGLNISTRMCSKDVDVDAMRAILRKSGGSFTDLFETIDSATDKKSKKEG